MSRQTSHFPSLFRVSKDVGETLSFSPPPHTNIPQTRLLWEKKNTTTLLICFFFTSQLLSDVKILD